jgi:hypothetical protein
MASSAVTSFTVTPWQSASRVRISTAWDGAGGVGGLFERMFAPRVLRAIYADELKRFDAYARETAPHEPAAPCRRQSGRSRYWVTPDSCATWPHHVLLHTTTG